MLLFKISFVNTLYSFIIKNTESILNTSAFFIVFLFFCDLCDPSILQEQHPIADHTHHVDIVGNK